MTTPGDDTIILKRHGSAYRLEAGELVQYPLNADGTISAEGAVVDFDRGVTPAEANELRAVARRLELRDPAEPRPAGYIPPPRRDGDRVTNTVEDAAAYARRHP